MAKLFASEAGRFCVEESFRIHGGYGYSKEYEIERLYRDAPLLLIGEGTSEIQRMVIGRKLLQRHKIWLPRAAAAVLGAQGASYYAPVIIRRRLSRTGRDRAAGGLAPASSATSHAFLAKDGHHRLGYDGGAAVQAKPYAWRAQ